MSLGQFKEKMSSKWSNNVKINWASKKFPSFRTKSLKMMPNAKHLPDRQTDATKLFSIFILHAVMQSILINEQTYRWTDATKSM